MNLPEGLQYGLIADEVQQVIPGAVQKAVHPAMYENDDEHNGKKISDEVEFNSVNYIEMIPILISGVKEQQEMIKSKDAKISDLQNQLNEMKQCVESLCSGNIQSKTAAHELPSTSTLYQNSPNPFNQSTVIRYNLSSDVNDGKIIIRDLNGNLLKQISIASKGSGQVTINANELSQGTYTYTLEINGASVDTKLMVVTK